MAKKEKRRKHKKLAKADRASAPAPAAAAPEAAPFVISQAAVQNARIAPPRGGRSLIDVPLNPAKLFAPYKPPPGVVPEGDPVLAMDDSSGITAQEWARGGYAETAANQGQAFIGFPALALLSQRSEYRRISEVISTEMTRKWITFKSLDGSDKTKKIKEIEEDFTRFRVRECFQEAALHDGFFGRAHLYLDFGADNLATSIGDGSDLEKAQFKIGKNSLKGMRVVEPVWVYPQNYNSNDPLSPDWYKPSGWYVLGKQVDASRLLTFVGREVPDLLKPSYAFAGLSMSQMAMPTIDNWLDVRAGVTDVIKAFSVFVLSTNASDILAGGAGVNFYSRLDVFNATRDNRGVLAIDKEKESFANVSAPLGSLDHLQAQAQEHICSVSGIPLVKYTGISPSGLNASSEGELQVFAEGILAYQEHLYRPNLTTVLRFVQLSRYGAVDPQIGFDFAPLVEETEQERATVRKTNAETGEILIRAKAISSSEERGRVIKETESLYRDLDPKAEVAFPMTESEKAATAGQIVTAAATLVAEGIIEIPDALREIQAHAKLTGFGQGIDDAMIREAEEAAAAAPDPSEALAAANAGGDPASGDPEPPEAGGGAKGAKAPAQPPVTKGVQPLA